MTAAFDRLTVALSDRYRLQRELGAGGMATVYLAEDLKHDRQVAIKVLRPELAAVIGAERFLTEIKTTAHLQHPHILPLHDSGECDGFLYYVMPLIEGETVRDRIIREKQLPIADAVRIARECALALDYAHRKGIVHRDIKPENILLQDGHPLVADFGIALAITRAGGTRVTQTGFALGTPRYMSPEQAAADRSIDGRTDVYSLGAVCYEMLAGEPPFMAVTAQETVGKLLSEPPRPLGSLRRTVPAGVASAIHQSLEKLPADRWTTPGEFAAALLASVTGGGPASTSRPRRLPLLAGSSIIVVALAAALIPRAIRSASPRPEANTASVRHLSIQLPDSAPFSPTSDEFSAPKQGIAISPDGNLVAYVGRRGTSTALHLVRLADGSVTPLEGTDGARLPAFSPDGRWLAFLARNELRKVSVDGGPIVRLSTVDAPTGLFWLSDEKLLVSRSALGPGTVPASGGRFEWLGEKFHATSFIHTQLLPDGTHLLGTTAYGDLATISLASGDLQFITHGSEQGRGRFGNALRGRNPHYMRNGYLVFASGSSIMSVAFDLRTLRATGRPEPVASGVRAEGGPGEAHFAISEDETLVFAPGADLGNGALVWVNQLGQITDRLSTQSGDLVAFRLSRDGGRLATVVRQPNADAETRILDVARRVEDRARLDGEFVVTSWSADGRSLLGGYTPDTAPGRGCCFMGARLDVGRLTVAFAKSRYPILVEFDESPDGTLRCDDVVVTSPAASGATPVASQMGLLRRTDDSAPPRLYSNAVQGDCKFSPDGRWIAYTNSEGLFVTPATLDSSAGSNKLVPGASTQALWAPDGKAIFYSEGRGLFRIGLRITGDAVEPSEPQLLFRRDGLFTTWDVWGNGWDLGRDGRLLVWEGPVQPPAGHLNVITGLGVLAEQRSGSRGSPN